MSPSALARLHSTMGPRAELAQQIATAVDRVHGVQRSQSLVSGTLYPGGRIEGIVLGEGEIRVYILVNQEHFGQSLFTVGDQVHEAALQALRAAGDHRSARVVIEDIVPSRTAVEIETG